MDIFREIYYGNASEVYRKRKNPHSELRQKELGLYETIRNFMPEDNKDLLDNFLDIYCENFDEDLIDTYSQGLKTGILIGTEVGKFEI